MSSVVQKTYQYSKYSPYAETAKWWTQLLRIRKSFHMKGTFLRFDIRKY